MQKCKSFKEKFNFFKTQNALLFQLKKRKIYRVYLRLNVSNKIFFPSLYSPENFVGL